MIRVVIEELLIFLIPFGLFAGYLALRRRNPLVWAHWTDQSFWLVIAGLSCAILSFLLSGIFAERHIEGFEPTHLENGRVVPGQFR
jgi:Family of unknown function (DUF6111)